MVDMHQMFLQSLTCRWPDSGPGPCDVPRAGSESTSWGLSLRILLEILLINIFQVGERAAAVRVYWHVILHIAYPFLSAYPFLGASSKTYSDRTSLLTDLLDLTYIPGPSKGCPMEACSR